MAESIERSLDNIIRGWPLGALAAFLCGAWLGLGLVLQVLLLAMGIDILAGTFAAFNTKTLNSRVGWQGICKKVLTLLVVALAVEIETLLMAGVQTMSGVNVHIPVGEATTIYFVAIEGLSIIENAGEAGVPIPAVLRDALEKLRSVGEAEEAQP